MIEAVEEVREILDHEKVKYFATKEKARSTVDRLIKKQERGHSVTEKDLLTLYDSQGITPNLLVSSGLDIEVPHDFYKKVSEMHEGTESIAKTHKEYEIPFDEHPATEPLYFEDYLKLDFEGKILQVMEDHVILDRTAFYPTSGGQLHDIGRFAGPADLDVVDVFKQDRLIVHKVVGDTTSLKPGQIIKGMVNEGRRRQLAQHHTTTHIINGVARKTLGDHIWQAGAEKTEEKGRLDITHYETLDKDQLETLEKGANDIIERGLDVRSMMLPRDEAERRYGFRLYQGGAVPGEILRIVSIEGLDTEACGGTHLKNTSEARRITITGTKKIQDGIVRLEYVAGRKAKEMYDSDLEDLNAVMWMMGVTDPGSLQGRSEDLFEAWKKVRKFNSKARKLDLERKKEALDEIGSYLRESNALLSIGNWKRIGSPDSEKEPPTTITGKITRPHEYLSRSSVVFKVQRTQLRRTVSRFLKEISGWLEELDINLQD
jgi:alanyl-tRNA synthetase